MENKSYASLLGTLMYAQVAKDPIWFLLKVFNIDRSEESIQLFTKNQEFYVMYYRSNTPEVVGYANGESGGSKDDIKSFRLYFSFRWRLYLLQNVK